jgi:hypothetical protein
MQDRALNARNRESLPQFERSDCLPAFPGSFSGMLKPLRWR